MFAKVKVVCGIPAHRRLYSSIHNARRKYASMSPCSDCDLLRSKRSWLGKHPLVHMRCTASLSEQRKVHERWREKDEDKTRSAESVHTQMIQVLTYKMERMILHDSLPLPLNPANAQSIAEERWTDFDAISVIPIASLQGTFQPRTKDERNAPSPADFSDWQKELKTFKSSLFKEKSSLRLVKLPPKKLPKSFILRQELTASVHCLNQTSLKTERQQEKHSVPIAKLDKNSTRDDLEEGLSSHETQREDVPNLNMQFNVVLGSGKNNVDISYQDSTVQESFDICPQDAGIQKSVQSENIPPNNIEQISRVPAEKSHSLKAIQESKEAVHDSESFLKTSAISSAVRTTNQADNLPFVPQTDSSPLERESNERMNAALADTSCSNLGWGSMVSIQEEFKLDEGLRIRPDEASHDMINSEVCSLPAEDISTTDLEVDNVSVKSAPPVFQSKAKKIKDTKQKSALKNSTQTTKKAALSQPVDVEKRISMFNLDLVSYVDASVQAGMVSHAQATLNYYRYNGSQKSTKKVLEKDVDTSFLKIRDVKIYNLLMHAWAKQGKLEAVKQCFSAMKSDGIRPTLQSYAACLECIGRQDSPSLTVTERVLADVHKDGFDVKEIFNQCVFRKDEREFVYQAIKKAVPDYEPNSQGEISQYDNVLLESLCSETCEPAVEQNPYSGVVMPEELKERGDNQMQLEIAGDVKVKSVASRENPSEKCLKMREVLSGTKEEWRVMIRQGLERRIRHLRRKDKGEQGMTLYPYLKLLKLDDYVDQIMKEIHLLATEAETFSPGSSFLWRRLGHRLHQKAVIQQKMKSNITEKTLELYKQYADRYCDEDLRADNHRLCWQEICASNTHGPSLDQPDGMWPLHVVKGLGKLLYDIILYDVKFDGNVLKSTEERRIIPAFYTIYRNYGHTTKEEIKPHPTLVKVYVGSELGDLLFETRELPMLVPPLPWMSAQTGGYLLSSAPLVRLPDQAHGQRQMVKDTPPKQLYPVLDALNTLSACAWQINKPMLDLIVNVFNNKGNKDIDIPPPVSEAPPMPRLSKSMTSSERSKAHAERLKVKQQRSEMYSLWCNELYKLSIANKFREETFWFPHNLDFRGRTYPCPPHFNHLGSDVTRSILYFAKGKALGNKGLEWLKIHLINLTGFKKRAPNSERLEYADSLMEDILDSADNPLTGRKWWQKSDEPWQTLACCKEIALAMRSPDHTQFVSKFPVHQDGSCNGLQHYAALGRDQAGAESVNLHPFSEPKDVYSDVAVLVERERRNDAKQGSEVAMALEGFVRRKVIKQTVMTTVYGVTRYGAKYQILRQLKDIPEFPQQLAWPASMYLTEKTFLCLQEMFSATKEIQDWLTVSAHLISTVCGKPVDWVTPLGFPITQPYHKTTTSHRSGVGVTDSNSLFEKPNSRKQKNAFPPNFIHSLDSTHMMLTALHCLKAGITYVSVHDCFWTHPCDVEIMNKITREQFVALHGQPILQDLSDHLLARFGSHTEVNRHLSAWDAESHRFLDTVLSRVPLTGDFDLNNILKSTYFFS